MNPRLQEKYKKAYRNMTNQFGRNHRRWSKWYYTKNKIATKLTADDYDAMRKDKPSPIHFTTSDYEQVDNLN